MTDGEDGIERQNLICRAIIARQERITCHDLARAMVEHSDPEKMFYTLDGQTARRWHMRRAQLSGGQDEGAVVCSGGVGED